MVIANTIEGLVGVNGAVRDTVYCCELLALLYRVTGDQATANAVDATTALFVNVLLVRLCIFISDSLIYRS